jgi:predicted AAA+ superfamily ATPase
MLAYPNHKEATVKQVPQDHVLRRLALENPWWTAPHEVTFSNLEPRPYLDLFHPLVVNRRVRRAVVLMGPRRVGKTVMIHHAIRRLIAEGVNPLSICYVAIDNPAYVNLSLDRILELFQEATNVSYLTEPTFIFFDEIQYMRSWETHLKSLVDTFANVKCVASGSAAAALRLKSNESGAGRFTDFLLPPLTFYEYLSLLKIADAVSITETAAGPVYEAVDYEHLNRLFVEYLNFGGYPEFALSPDLQTNPGRFVKSDIIDKVLLRDLPTLYGIQDIQELYSLFTTLAFNTAQEVSLEEISKTSGVAKPTIKRYIEYLEAAFLIRVVHRVDRNARHFERQRCFKVYLANPSTRTALFSEVTPDGEEIGSLVETGVFAQWFHSSALLYYARWNSGEIDIVHLAPNQKITGAVEVKWTNRFALRPEQLLEVLKFCTRHNVDNLVVTSRTIEKRVRMSNVDVQFIPAALYSYFIGRRVIVDRDAAPFATVQ